MTLEQQLAMKVVTSVRVVDLLYDWVVNKAAGYYHTGKHVQE